MTARDKKGLCLGYALDRAEEITGLTVNDSMLRTIALHAARTGRVPETAPGLRRIEKDDVGPGDLLIMVAGSSLHAAVMTYGGRVEDVDPRGGKRRMPWRRVAGFVHSVWRLT